MTRILSLLTLLTLAACANAVDDGDPDGDEVGAPAPDAPIGTDAAGPVGEAPASDGIDALAADPDVDGADIMATGGPVAGAKMIVTRYAGFHSSASSTSSLLSVPPHAGVHDSTLHYWGNGGLLPPGAVTVLVDPTSHNGYLKVKYEAKTGWVSRTKLAWRNPTLSNIEFAMSAPWAFFKHQIHRSRLNKDGPSHSGNCAPTSMAMAARVFGKEPAGLSVEQSIHRVRHTYDPGLHESQGTTRAELVTAATALGLHVHSMSTALSPSAALTRIEDQLALGRSIVLSGNPGSASSTPTLYEQTQDNALHALVVAGVSIEHTTYHYNGGHAIFVLARRSDGKFIVADPYSEAGFIPMSGSVLKDFMTRWGGGTGVAVW